MFIDPIVVGRSCSRDEEAAREFCGVLHSMHVTCDNTAGAGRVSSGRIQLDNCRR